MSPRKTFVCGVRPVTTEEAWLATERASCLRSTGADPPPSVWPLPEKALDDEVACFAKAPSSALWDFLVQNRINAPGISYTYALLAPRT